MTRRGFISQPFTHSASPTQPREVGSRAGFIQKNQAIRIDPLQFFPPLLASLDDIRAILLAGVERLFLKESSSLPSQRSIVDRATVSSSCSLISASVASG